MIRKIRYNEGDEIVEVTVRDSSGARIEVRRCNLSDDRECGRLIKWLRDKYGFKMRFEKNWLELDNEFIKF